METIAMKMDTMKMEMETKKLEADRDADWSDQILWLHAPPS